MPLTNQLKNQHLLWRAGFGPMAENISYLDATKTKQLWQNLVKASADEPIKLNIASNPFAYKTYINPGGA